MSESAVLVTLAPDGQTKDDQAGYFGKPGGFAIKKQEINPYFSPSVECQYQLLPCIPASHSP